MKTSESLFLDFIIIMYNVYCIRTVHNEIFVYWCLTSLVGYQYTLQEHNVKIFLLQATVQ